MELREERRESRAEARRHRWESDVDRYRPGLLQLQRVYTDEDVSKMSKKLKSKCLVNAKDLQILMCAFSENPNNISIFFNTTGALQGLTRELTGSKAHNQLVAAGCLCNLSLGPPKTCLAVAKASGFYLITYLKSLNTNLLKLCAWTLGNLLASGDGKVSELLENQGIVNYLLPLLDNSQNQNVFDVTAYTISHIITSRCGILKDHHIEYITKALVTCKYKSEQTYWLLFLLTTYDASLNVFLSHCTLNNILIELFRFNSKNKPVNYIIPNCLIRIAANLIAVKAYNENDFNNYLCDENFPNTINFFLSSVHDDIRRETFWLVGNIFNYVNTSNKVFFFMKIVNCVLDCISTL